MGEATQHFYFCQEHQEDIKDKLAQIEHLITLNGLINLCIQINSRTLAGEVGQAPGSRTFQEPRRIYTSTGGAYAGGDYKKETSHGGKLCQSAGSLCLYCVEGGHFVQTCPQKSIPSLPAEN